MTVRQTLAEIKTWPVEERLDLVQAVWDSIAEQPESLPISDELRAELDRRIAEDDAHPDDVVTWEETLRALRQEQ